MYDELYAAWRLEIENGELGSLPIDFYARATDYLRRINEENKMIEKKSLKTTLLEHELKNAQRMVQELISGRYKKMLKMIDFVCFFIKSSFLKTTAQIIMIIGRNIRSL